jgi:tRNA A-37 threonylcarbamoyl transferase component Bud32
MAATAPSEPELARARTDEDIGGETDRLVGELLVERYEITRKIGQGGMGAVYEATHKLIGKRVAVKVLLDKYARKDQIVARLEQEARLASSIGHEHIIDITDFGETHDGRTFVVMEFLDGESLGACIQREGHLPEQRAIRIAYQIAGALHAAHEKGILHRDIKPENVFLLKRKGEDFVKVVDFGISKSLRTGEDEEHSPRLTQTGMVLGTPLYMAPEQARGADELDRRIDVYSLGVILYEMVTGQVPFQGNNYLNIISRVLNDEPRPPREMRPELSQEFEDVILRALEKEPDNRYASCEDLAADLAVLIEDPGHSTSRGRITASRYRRRRGGRSGLGVLAWIAGVAVTIGAVVVTVAVLMAGTGNSNAGEPDAAALPIVMAPPDAGPPPADARPAVEIVAIHITSDPEGATIYQGGRVIGITPLDYSAPKENRQLEFIAELDQYNDSSFVINPLLDFKDAVRIRMKKPQSGRKVIKIRKDGDQKSGQTGGQKSGQTGGQKSGDQSGQKDGQKSGTAGGELGGNPYAPRNP